MNLLIKINRFILPQDESIGYSAYVNLLFLSLFFGNLYFRPVHGVEMAIVIAGLITFLLFYFRANFEAIVQPIKREISIDESYSYSV